MSVAPITLVCLSLATLFVAALPVSLYRRLRQPFALDWRDTIAGVAVFAFFATVIERALNDYVLHGNAAAAQVMTNPVFFVLYGAFAAGVCEEVGRYIAMRLIERRRARKPNTPADSTAFGYGIGHAGAEAWFVGVLVQLQWIVFAVLANRGNLDEHLSNLTMDSVLRVHLILASLSPLFAGVFAMERTAWKGILPLAILVHALIDVPAAMYQARLAPLVAVDGFYAVAAAVVAVVLFRTCRRERRVARAA